MERIGRVFHSFEEARRAELAEELALTPDERRAIARALRLRVYGAATPDVRASGEARKLVRGASPPATATPAEEPGR